MDVAALLVTLNITKTDVNTLKATHAQWQIGDELPIDDGTRPFVLVFSESPRQPRAILSRPIEKDRLDYVCYWSCEFYYKTDDAELFANPGLVTRLDLEMALADYGLMLRDIAAGIDARASSEELIFHLRQRWRQEYPIVATPTLRFATLAITLWHLRKDPTRFLDLETALFPVLPGHDTPPSSFKFSAHLALLLSDDERKLVKWMGNGTIQVPGSGFIRRRLRHLRHVNMLRRMVRKWQRDDEYSPPANMPLPPLLLSGTEATHQLRTFYAPIHPWIAFLASRELRFSGGLKKDETLNPWQLIEGDIEDLASVYPPCIRRLFEAKEDHFKHEQRFTVACYLSSCGVDQMDDFLHIAEPGKLAQDVPSFVSAVKKVLRDREKYPQGQSCKLMGTKGFCIFSNGVTECAAAHGLQPNSFYSPNFFTIQQLRKRRRVRKL
jgi:hypothetical protein